MTIKRGEKGTQITFFPSVHIFQSVLYNYSLKACWNSNFWASRGHTDTSAKISPFFSKNQSPKTSKIRKISLKISSKTGKSGFLISKTGKPRFLILILIQCSHFRNNPLARNKRPYSTNNIFIKKNRIIGF